MVGCCHGYLDEAAATEGPAARDSCVGAAGPEGVTRRGCSGQDSSSEPPIHTELIQAMIADRDRIHKALDDVRAALVRWMPAGGAGAAGEVLGAIARLSGELVPHLDTEEREIIPLLARHLSTQERGEMPGHALRAFDGDRVWLILGLIRENMNQDQRDSMLAHMPPPARDMWINIGNAAFDEFITEIRNR